MFYDPQTNQPRRSKVYLVCGAPARSLPRNRNLPNENILRQYERTRILKPGCRLTA